MRGFYYILNPEGLPKIAQDAKTSST